MVVVIVGVVVYSNRNIRDGSSCSNNNNNDGGDRSNSSSSSNNTEEAVVLIVLMLTIAAIVVGGGGGGEEAAAAGGRCSGDSGSCSSIIYSLTQAILSFSLYTLQGNRREAISIVHSRRNGGAANNAQHKSVESKQNTHRKGRKRGRKKKKTYGKSKQKKMFNAEMGSQISYTFPIFCLRLKASFKLELYCSC